MLIRRRAGNEVKVTLLKLEKVSKSYMSGSKQLHVLRQIDLYLDSGEFMAIVGRSGSGKTTLLNCIAGLDRINSGSMLLDGVALNGLSDKGWDQVRRDQVGFVFQFNNLLPEFTALENVQLPGLLKSSEQRALHEKACYLLAMMGLSERMDHLPNQLSGGEQQRVAIARALINDPKLLLADEPTGSLDIESGQKVFNLLLQLQKDLKISCLVVTHNPALAALCARIHRLEISPGNPGPSKAGADNV